MHPRSPKASVTLMVLCCVTVLGIALASYLAVSNQAMKLSNRAYAQDVSRHLAEMGLERALDSFANSTFSSWTLSGITATLATPLTISTSHYGNSGLTTEVKLRVDHYRDTATNMARNWSWLTAYAVNAFVYYQGVWYLCISASPAGTAPSNATYWKSAPEPWSSAATYKIGNIALSGGSAYRCILAHANQVPPNGTYWTPYSVAAWNSGTSYSVDDVVLAGGAAYRCIAANSNNTPPNTTYWLSAPIIYAEGIATLPDGTTAIKTQLRAYVAPAPLFSNAAGATTYTNLASSGTVDSYNSNLATSYAAQVGTTTNYSAVIAGGNASSTAVSITTVTVKGYVAAPSSTTPPYAPLWNYGAATVTGSAATGVDLTRVSRSPYIPQFDIQAVTGAGNLPAAAGAGTILNQGAISLGTPGASTPSIYNITATYDGGTPYTGLDLWQSNHDLTIDGPVILNVSGLFRIRAGSITISNTGSLEIYFSGLLDIGNASFASAGIDNNTNDPKKCLIASTNATNTSGNHYLRTQRPFIGVIYMPNAYLHMQNSGFSNQLYGALSAKNIYFQHTANLHYDTSLRTAGRIGTFIDGPFLISEWRELTNPAERVVLP